MKKLNVQQMENVSGGCNGFTLGAGIAIGIASMAFAAPVFLGAAVAGIGVATAGVTLGAAGIAVSIVECLQTK